MARETVGRLRWVLIWWVAVAMCLGQVEVAHSADQGERVKALETKLDQTLDLVRALSQRVEELEAQLASRGALGGGNGEVAVAQPSGGDGTSTGAQPSGGNGGVAGARPSNANGRATGVRSSGGDGQVAAVRPSGSDATSTGTLVSGGNGQVVVAQPAGVEPSGPGVAADQAELTARSRCVGAGAQSDGGGVRAGG